VPGTVDGCELAVRAILGQQISVAAATTLAGRLAAALGEPIETPFAGLDRLTPTAERIAETSTAALAALGMRSGVAAAVSAVAAAIAEGRIVLEPGAVAEEVAEQLVELPGVGEWTAQYIAMRALRWPDALPASDLGLLKAAGVRSPALLTERAEAWRPWRAYAAMYLWESLHELSTKVRPSTTKSRISKPPTTKRRQLAGSLT
jgi:AraC family transcriptional regulator of adaptative response / DNA-3-methyladenine glycosylase II